LGQITFRELVTVFTEQAQGLLEGGVDLIIIETAQDILEVKAAVFGVRDAIRFLGEFSPVPIHCIPNAGIPHQGPNGETIFPETPEQISTALGEFVERYGVNIVGGCCGTTPDHIYALAQRVEGRESSTRPAPRPAHVSSMITAAPLVQEPRPTLVGERVNSQGSRKAKELLLADDYDGLLQVAEDQVEGGAHVLDICVALTERQDEDEQMRQ